MTKKDHIDELHEMLGEAKREDIPKQMCEVALNDAYNQVCWDLFRSGLRRYDLCRKRFTAQAVTWDSTAGVYYTTYPAAIVPDINLDMILETVKGSGLLFRPADEKTLRLSYNLQSNSLNTDIRTILKRERLEYDNMESLSIDEIEDGSSPTPRVSQVRMDLAIQFKEFANDDEVYMPAGRDYEVKQLAMDYLMKQQIIDVRND